MNWTLRTYQHEADRSHTHELVVACAWTVMFVLLVAASLLRPAYEENRDGIKRAPLNSRVIRVGRSRRPSPVRA